MYRCAPMTEANEHPLLRSFRKYGGTVVPHEVCSYDALGAGPGATTTYLVDLPLPWGKDTEVTLPIDALVNDAMAVAQPAVDASIMRGVVAAAAAVALAVGLGAWWIRSKR